MIQSIRRTLPLFLALSALGASLSAPAQFYKLHGDSLSVGGIGQFTTPLTSSTSSGVYNVPFRTGATTYSTTISNQQQGTTNSAGFLVSLQMQPAWWAGVEFNYAFTHYSERYNFNYSNTTTRQGAGFPTDAHEATAAYSFHPRHIPLQPFLNIGGGAIDFAPRNASNQWRGAGLAELGIDLPTPSKHLAFRIEGRALVYRAPNFYYSAISTRSWRVTEEPSISATYKF